MPAAPAAAAPLISSVQKLVLYETRAVSSVCPPPPPAPPLLPGAGEEPRLTAPVLGQSRRGMSLLPCRGAAASAGLQLVKKPFVTFLLLLV